jgi:hypothetical protein
VSPFKIGQTQAQRYRPRAVIPLQWRGGQNAQKKRAPSIQQVNRRRRMVREGPAQRLPEDYDADNARGGVLRRRRQRLAFIGGLIGAVLLVIILRIMSAW